MTNSLSVEQAYYLHRLTTLLNAEVSSQQWLMYLVAVNEGLFDDVSQQNQVLATFLDWPQEDIPYFTTGDEIGIENGWIKTVQQIDYVRLEKLCRDLYITGEQLEPLNSANSDEPQWSVRSSHSSQVRVKTSK